MEFLCCQQVQLDLHNRSLSVKHCLAISPSSQKELKKQNKSHKLQPLPKSLSFGTEKNLDRNYHHDKSVFDNNFDEKVTTQLSSKQFTDVYNALMTKILYLLCLKKNAFL